MARTTGPLFSFDASGSLGGAIVYSKWRGRKYTRILVTPANPKSAAQVGVRAMMKFLSQNWAAIGATPKATWDVLAAASNFLPFNAYVQANQKIWTQFETPYQTTPNPKTGTVATPSTTSATGGVGTVSIVIDNIGIGDNWGYTIHRSLTTGFTPARNNAIAVILADSGAQHTFEDSGLKADTYFYNYHPFTKEGVKGTALGQDTATVT